jgi:hypothetical protein
VTKHALRIAGLVTMVVLLAAGCGGQEFPQTSTSPTTTPRTPVAGNPRATLLASIQRTAALKSARVALSMDVVGGSDGSMTVSGTGALDFVNKAAALSMRGDENGQVVTTDVRLVGGTVYVRNDGAWLSAPAKVTDLSAPNPETYLTYLQNVSPDVRLDGHETLRGVDTTRYRASIDLGRAVAQASSPAEQQALAQALKVFGGAKVPTTVWIDADGHLRKMQLSFDLGVGLSLTAAPKIVIVLELYDFGVPVHVVAPGAAVDPTGTAQIRVVQSDLRSALVAEKTYFTGQQRYTADRVVLKQIERSLDWGGKLTVVVGNEGPNVDAVVCLSEASAHGPGFSIADVASGPYAGTYYGHTPCPPVIDDAAAVALGPHW